MFEQDIGVMSIASLKDGLSIWAKMGTPSTRKKRIKTGNDIKTVIENDAFPIQVGVIAPVDF